jgi:regulator of sigma E protease
MDISGILTVLQFIGAIALLIIIHELGHFAAAKWVGVEVEEFGLGFPPRAIKLFEHAGTIYSLNWLPLGGFVRPKGENNPDIPGGMAAAAPWKRLVILAAGPLMNLLAGVILFTFLFFNLGEPLTDQVIVTSVIENTPAHAAGLQSGDLFVAVDGHPITSDDELIALIGARPDLETELTIEREGELLTLFIVPENIEGQGKMGVYIGNPRQPTTLGRAFMEGNTALIMQSRMMLTLPFQIMDGSIDPEAGRVVGYKGMYDLYNYALEADNDLGAQFNTNLNTIGFFATITVSLGLLNLLPIPALDGGRILFLLPELLFKKRVPQNLETLVHFVGISVLILLMLYVNIQDFTNPLILP